MATLKWTDGKMYEVPDDEVQQALSDGFVAANSADEAAQHPVQAGIEAAARGATFGLSDPFLAVYTGDAAGIKARKEANPIASTVGEMAGAVGTSLATGGGASALVGGGLKGAAFEGGLYGMGSLISESSLENKPVTVDRLAASFAGGALAGGAIHGGMTALGKGASAVMSKVGGGTLKDALRNAADDAEWRALIPDEKWRKLNEPYKNDLLAFGREKGIIGATSAFDQATSGRARDVAKAYADEIGGQVKQLEGYVPMRGDDTLRSDLVSFVKGRLRSEFGKNPNYDSTLSEMGTKLNKLGEDRSLIWGDVWDFQSSLFKDMPPGGTPPVSAEVRETTRKAIRDFVFDEVASGKNKAAKVLTASGGFAPALKTKLPAPVAEPVTVNLSEPTAAGGVFPVQGAGITVEGMHPSLAGTQLISPDVAATPLGRDIPGSLGRTRGAVSVEGAVSSPGGIFTFPGATENVLSAAPTVAREGLPAPVYAPHTVTLGEEAGGRVGGLLMDLPAKETPAWFGAKMRQTGKEARMALSLAAALEKKTASLERASMFGGIDSMSGMGAVASAVSGNPVPLVGAVAGDALRAQMRKRGGFLAGAALRSLAESSALKGASTGLMARFQQIMSIAPEALGAYKYPLMAAASHGADALLEEHLRLASSPYGADYMAKMGLEAETPEQVDATGRKVAILDALHAAGQSDDKEIDSLFGSAPGRKGGVPPSVSPKEFSLFQQRTAALMADPSQAFEGVPADIRAAAPSITGEAMAGSLRAIQFLQSKAPKDPYAGMPESVKPEWQPSAADLDRFSRYKEAVEKPAQVLKNMANGYIAPEQVQALQAVYPALYADLQQKIGERLAMWQKPLTYQQRLAFSAILGPKALAMKPEQVQILQQATSVATAGSQGPSGGKPMKGPDGRQDVNEEQVQTEAQKLEAR